MSSWVAIDVAVGDNAKVRLLAEHLFGARPHALAATVGHLAMLYGRVMAAAPTGELAGVPDSLLEDWAHWRGKHGQFAAAIRERFLDADGTLHDWEEWNGSHVRQMKRARERARAWRESRAEGDANAQRTRTEPAPNGNGAAGVPRTYLPTHLPTTTTPPTPPQEHPRGKRAGSGHPTWLTPARDAWERHFGPGSFTPRKGAALLAPMHAAGVAPEEIGRRLDRYITRRRGKFCTLADFAEHHGEYAAKGPATLLDGGIMSPQLEEDTRPSPPGTAA